MPTIFLGLAVVLAIWNWVSLVSNQPAWVEYVTKPGALFALIAWLVAQGGLDGERLPFTLGLCLCLAGDILLMLPEKVLKKRFFLGLVAFLLGHLAYIFGLNSELPPLDLASLAVSGAVVYTGYRVYQRLARGMERNKQTELRLPVLVYLCVICTMVCSALLTLVRNGWQTWAALSIASGALLFLLSDSWLAWSTFVAPLPQARLRVRVAYHLGQFLITSAVLLQFPV